MEEGTGDVGGLAWSYSEVVRSSSYTIIGSSSTASGTISTAHASTESRVSSSDWQVRSLELLEYHAQLGSGGEQGAKKHDYVKGLVQEFLSPSAANRSISGGGEASSELVVLERWLTELDVGWVLHVADDAAKAESLWQHNFARRWIRALIEITESMVNLSYYSFAPDHCSSVVEQHVSGDEDKSVMERHHAKPDHAQLARFAEATILKMLPFVSAIVASTSSTGIAAVGNGAPAPSYKLHTLLDMRYALSSAPACIRLRFNSEHSAEGKKIIRNTTLQLLSAKEQELDEAAWDTMDGIRSGIIFSSSWWATPTSSDVHKVTLSVINCIQVLSANHRLVHHVLCQAAKLGKYVPEIGSSRSPLTSLTMEIASDLEEKLAKKSQSIANQSLRFLFLVNNLHFIWQHIHPMSDIEFHMLVLAGKIDDYIRSYLQVSWAPVMSSLDNNAATCFGRSSPLPKFEAKFQKTYTDQKQWKVPNPELRRRLRNGVIEKVTSGLAEYLEDNDITTPSITPQDLEP